MHSQNRCNGEKHKIGEVLITNLPINGEDKGRVHYLIDRFNDFNSLHRTASLEQIIACFCYYIMLTHNPLYVLSDYKIFNELQITPDMYYLIITRMLKQEQEHNNLKFNKN